MLSRIDCIHHVNAKRFVIWLKVSALNRIQHEERETRGRTRLPLYALQISLISIPSHYSFLIAFSVYILEAVKNWTMGWLGNDVKHVLTSYLLIRPNITINSLCQIVILQLQTQNLFSHHLAFTHITYTPKSHWSRLQTTSWKWFMNRFTNWLLSWFSAFTPSVSKPVQ